MTDQTPTEQSDFQPPLLGLELTPTIAMRRGVQQVYQCSQCGLVAIQSDLAAGPLGRCPACPGGSWWRQEIPKRGSASSLAGCRI